MSFPTDGFENDIRTLYRYGIKETVLPVRRVKYIIDMNSAMMNRLISLCPISKGSPVTLKTADGKVDGHVTAIGIRVDDGAWTICTDIHEGPIDFEYFTEMDDVWFAEVK